MYMIGKLKIYYLSEPCKLGEKLAFGEVILPVSHQMQTYFIFIDIVCVLCLSCNVKKSKHQRSIVFILQCQKVLKKVLKKKLKKKFKKPWKNRNRCRTYRFSGRSISRRCVYYYSFLPFALHGSNTRKALLGS